MLTVCFRSRSILNRIIMETKVTVAELKQRSQKADEIIHKLNKQIEQIKLQTTPEFMAKRANELKSENEKLRKKVEELKKELEAAEAANPKPVESEKKEGKKEANKPKGESAGKKEAKVDKEPPKIEAIDVSKLDIRVGKIVECGKHPEADSLYVEKIDLGEEKPRNVCSGLVKFIPLDQMQNRMVVVLCNLKPTKLRGVLSEAMVLCASTPEKVELMVPPENSVVGDRVTVDGFDGQPAPECNPKNNIFGVVQPDLKTDDNLIGTYKGLPMEVKGKGPIKSSSLKGVPIK